MAMTVLAIAGALIVFLAIPSIRIVPQQNAWILQTLGKFDHVLQPGFHLVIPYIQQVAYKHSLKEQALDVNRQTAITKDNVSLNIDGVLYVKIVDPVDASYGVSDPYYALGQLAQTTMRSEIGKMTLDNTFEEREKLNIAIVESINEASSAWGIQCMRYEIRDIDPPRTVLDAMELQVAADRRKRAEVLESEGKRDAEINKAQGEKQSVVLESEAAMIDQVNRAKGEAEALLAVAQATAESIHMVAEALNSQGGTEAASLRVAEDYVAAFRQLAQESTTVLLPANANDASSMVAQAMTVFNQINEKMGTDTSNKKPAKQSDGKRSPYFNQISRKKGDSDKNNDSGGDSDPSPWGA